MTYERIRRRRREEDGSTRNRRMPTMSFHRTNLAPTSTMLLLCLLVSAVISTRCSAFVHPTNIHHSVSRSHASALFVGTSPSRTQKDSAQQSSDDDNLNVFDADAEAAIQAQFKYNPLIWMFCSRKNNRVT